MRVRPSKTSFLIAMLCVLIAASILVLDLEVIPHNVPLVFLYDVAIPLLIVSGGMLSITGAILGFYAHQKGTSRKRMTITGIVINLLLVILFIYWGVILTMPVRS